MLLQKCHYTVVTLNIVNIKKAQKQLSLLTEDEHKVNQANQIDTFQETPPVMAEVELDEAGEPLARQLDQV